LCAKNYSAVSYLVSKLDLENHRTTNIGVIDILGKVESLYGYETEIKDKLIEWLDTETVKTDDYFMSSIIRFLGHFVDIDTAKELYSIYSLHNKSTVRTAANAVLYERKLGEYFVEQLIQGKRTAKLVARFTREDANDEDIADAGESWYLSLAIKDLQNQSALIQFGKILLDKQFSECDNVFEDYFEALNKIDAPSEEMKVFLTKIFVAFERHGVYGQKDKILRDIIKKLNLNEEAVKAVIKSNMYPWMKIDAISKIYKEITQCLVVRLLMKEEYKKQYAGRFVFNLSYFYDKWQDVKLMLEQSGLDCTLPENYEEKRKQSRQDEFNTLFNKNNVINEISKVFEIAGKDALNWHDVCEIDYTIRQDIDHFSISFFSGWDKERVHVGDITKNVSEAWIMHQMYKLLSDKQEIKVSESQKEYIQVWCNKKLEDIDFKTAIHYKDKGGWSTSWEAIIVAFFIQKLDLNCPTQIYSDLICFSWGENGQTFETLEFLEQKLGASAFANEITNHINQHRFNSFILENRLNYCMKRNIDAGEGYIVTRCRNIESVDEFSFHTFVRYMIHFNSIENLMCFYDTYNLKFKLTLLKHLVESQLIENYKEHFEQDVDKKDADSIAIAAALLSCGSLISLKYYYEWAKENNAFFLTGFDFRTPEIAGDYSMDSVDTLINLLKLSYEIKTRHNFLQNDIDKVLSSIAMKSIDNLAMVVNKLQIFIEDSKEENAHYQSYYIDKILHEFIRNNIAIV